MVLALAVFAACLLPAGMFAASDEAPRITKEEALKLHGKPKVLFVDARTTKTWSRSDRMIAGAVRIDKWDLELWSSSYPADTVFIVY